MQKIEPVNNNIVISPIKETETKTTSGIYLPDSSKESPNRGKVIAVASNVEEIKVGDIIIFKGFSNDILEINNEEYILLPADDVSARIIDVDAIPE